MLKPASIRAHLTAALPALQRAPENLTVFITSGRLKSTRTQSLSWEYSYTLRLLFLDYTGHVDAVMAPLLVWLRTHQSEVLDNPQLREKAIRFDVEYLNNEALDLAIDLDLTERVVCRPREGVPGGLNLHHVPEPPDVLLVSPGGRTPPSFDLLNPADPHDPAAAGGAAQERWSFWLKDEMLSQRDHDPRIPALKS